MRQGIKKALKGAPDGVLDALIDDETKAHTQWAASSIARADTPAVRVRMPTERFISPADGTQCRFNPITQTYADESGNEFSLSSIEGTRKLKEIHDNLQGHCV